MGKQEFDKIALSHPKALRGAKRKRSEGWR